MGAQESGKIEHGKRGIPVQDEYERQDRQMVD